MQLFDCTKYFRIFFLMNGTGSNGLLSRLPAGRQAFRSHAFGVIASIGSMRTKGGKSLNYEAVVTLSEVEGAAVDNPAPLLPWID